MMVEPKRKVNFSDYEKTLLLDLAKDKSIISSSAKDAKTKLKKESAWKVVEKDFNKDENVKNRTVTELKTCFLNIIQRAKQSDSKFKQEVRKTGGGAPSSPLSPHSEIIREMLPQVFHPLNCNDDDAMDVSLSDNLQATTNNIDTSMEAECSVHYNRCISQKSTVLKSHKSDVKINFASVEQNSTSLHETRLNFMTQEHKLRIKHMEDEHK